MPDAGAVREALRERAELRELARQDPERCLPRLGACLHGLASLLTEDPERFGESAEVLGEAVEVFRKLAALDAEGHASGLAATLGRRALVLGLLGRRAEAYEQAREATDLLRDLARREPGLHLPDLARSLTNLGNQLAELGRHHEALEVIREGVAIRRRLGERDALASALGELGIKLGEMGRGEEGVVTLREAVDLFRAAAPRADPGERYATVLALIHHLHQLGREAEAAPYVAEFVDLRRSVATGDPGRLALMEALLRRHGYTVTPDGRFRREASGSRNSSTSPSSASSPPPSFPLDRVHGMNDQALRLVSAGNLGLAAEILRDAVALCRTPATTDTATPTATGADAALALARSLHNQGLTQGWLGRHADALASADEAVGLYRRHLKAHERRIRPALADALDSLGNRLAALARHPDALTAAEESVALFRRLAEDDPRTHLPSLARAMNNLSIRLTDTGRHEEALRSSREVVAIYRGLRVDDPEKHMDGAIHALANLALRLARADREDEVLAPTMEAVDLLFGARGPHHPSSDVARLAESLAWLARYLRKNGRRGEARTVRRAASALRP
ncbi:tetratricopeptide repeat protein [Streptomyces sp. NPDC047981]|uniref:tetratricopeptide repeat protein n=1 Tax=Streptomyces sp. NPDC047981 TaxID=3154610 RepID=UPI00342AA79A